MDAIETLESLGAMLFDIQRGLKRFGNKLSPFPELIKTFVALERDIAALSAGIECEIVSQRTEIETPLSAEEVESACRLNRQLQVVSTHLREVARDILPQLGAKLSDPDDAMYDYEVEARIDYVLSEDDPGFDEQADNYLASRCEGMTRLDSRGESEIESFAESGQAARWQQGLFREPHCWLFHDLYDHSYGPAQPALSFRDCARIGKIFVDVQIWQQYCFDVKTGAWRKS